jgi:hypothetical protein
MQHQPTHPPHLHPHLLSTKALPSQPTLLRAATSAPSDQACWMQSQFEKGTNRLSSCLLTHTHARTHTHPFSSPMHSYAAYAPRQYIGRRPWRLRPRHDAIPVRGGHQGNPCRRHVTAGALRLGLSPHLPNGLTKQTLVKTKRGSDQGHRSRRHVTTCPFRFGIPALLPHGLTKLERRRKRDPPYRLIFRTA